MKNKKTICGEIARRYQQADKKGRGKLLDEYMGTLGYNRDYLAHIRSNWGKTRYTRIDGTPVKIMPYPPLNTAERLQKRPLQAANRAGGQRGAAFTALLEDIWGLFDCLCGRTCGPQLLAPLLRLMTDFLSKRRGRHARCC
ncbi:MAG: hypothetical protein LBU25_06380 [Treponema sp.]|jgi:hypothetical protein|nr:hypothetical protein [Treponema sp.]